MSTQLQRCLISTETTFDIFIGHAIINIGEIIYLLYDYGFRIVEDWSLKIISFEKIIILVLFRWTYIYIYH